MDALPGPRHEGVSATARRRLAMRSGTPHRPHGERPHPVRSSPGGQQPTPAPAAATDVDHVGTGGAHGVAVDAVGLQVTTTSTLEGRIQPTDDHTGRDAHGHQPLQQQPTGTKRRPNRPMQDTMRGLNMGGGAESHDTQRSGHGPLPRCAESTGAADFHLWPHRFGKDRRQDGHDPDACGRQREQRHPVVAEEWCAFTA
jgi:hypothetical protein